MISGHGGDIYGLARQLGCRADEISDMSANVNPIGPPPELMDHLQALLPAVTALPEVDAAGIVAAFSRFHDIDPGQVMAGNGTTELIYRIPRALAVKRALVVGPTYADYQDACTMNQVACDWITCRESDNFAPDMAALRKGAARADLVFFCNPNNPTGVLTRRAEIHEWCSALPDTVFVIDESYLPFTPQPDDATMIRSTLPNVMVLNSMSKIFRIPGLRIGFVKAPPPLMAKLLSLALPWAVNSLAQVAVHWLMAHPEAVKRFLAATRLVIFKEKLRIEESIHQNTSIHCYPSATSFMLMRLPKGMGAATLWRHMAEQRILIRDCSNFGGLSEAFIRISIKTAAENRRATDLLVRFCSDPARPGDDHGD